MQANINLIAAVDENWGIGCNNKLLISIPEDMRFFKNKTQGKVVIMGHGTLKSLPKGLPLKNRINIVLSKNSLLKIDDAIVLNSIEPLFNRPTDTEMFVIGGANVYSQLLPFCKTAYITKIFAHFPADVHFPNLDLMRNWEVLHQSEKKTYNNIDYMFLTYNNTALQQFSNPAQSQ